MLKFNGMMQILFDNFTTPPKKRMFGVKNMKIVNVFKGF